LDSISVEPRKLDFTKLEANYQKAKKSSSKKWMLILLCIILSLGSLVTGYFMMQKNPDNSLTKSDIKLSINSNSKEITKEIKDINSNHTAALDAKQNDDTKPTSENVNESSTTIQSATSLEATKPESNNKSDNTISKVIRADVKPEKVTKTNSSLTTNNENKNSSNSAASTQRSEPNVASTSKEIKALEVKEPSSNKKSQEKNNTSDDGKSSVVNTSKIESNKNTNSKNSAENEYKNVFEASTSSTSSVKLNEVNTNPLVDQKQVDVAKEKTGTKTDTLQKTSVSSVIDTLSENKEQKSVIAQKPADQNSVTVTSTITPEKSNKHQFSISTEVIYSAIKFAATPNTNVPATFNQNGINYPQMFSDGTTGNSYSLFSGAAILGYSFKNSLGINIGVGFFNVETKINSRSFTQPITTTVFDHYLYDSSFQIVDTIYKPGTTRNIVVVNGDTVAAQDYLNNIRFVTIPFSVSYKFGLTKKFSIEPQAGIQYALPIKSNQLVALKPYVFEYSKNKLFLNTHSIFFDLAIKINYKIATNTNLYLKQGYFFNNKSIYNTDYLLDYRLKNVYTSFGISILLK
jgi:hypothetical protein